jgi:hypothetical protein
MELRSLNLLDQHSITELHPQPKNFFFKYRLEKQHKVQEVNPQAPEVFFRSLVMNTSLGTDWVVTKWAL